MDAVGGLAVQTHHGEVHVFQVHLEGQLGRDISEEEVLHPDILFDLVSAR